MEKALCLNCGVLIAHQAGEHVAMAFRPDAERLYYFVAIDGVEVHRCN